MADNVETAIYRLSVEGQDKIDRLTQSIDGLSTAVEPANGRTRTFSQTLQNLIGRSDETVGGLNRIQKAWETYERFAEAGAGTQTQLAALFDITTKKVNEQAVALENMRRAQSNASTGPGQTVSAAGGSDAYAAQFEAAAKAQDEQVASINRLRTAINPLETEQGKLGTQMANYRVLLQQGRITQTEYTAAQDMAAQSLAKYGGAAVEAGHAHAGFSTQAQSAFHAARGFAEQLLVGIPITQAAASEMNHLTYAATGAGGLSGAFKEVAGFIGGLITPTTAAIASVAALTAAAVALAAAYDKVNVSSQLAISGAGARTGTTVTDINSFVQKNSGSFGTNGTSGLSEKEARELAEAYTKSGEIVVGQLTGMSNAVVGFANKSGKSVSEAIKVFEEFDKDPRKAVAALTEQFGELDVSTRLAIDAAIQQDDKTRVLTITMQALADKTAEAAKQQTLLSSLQRGVIVGAGAETAKPTGLEGRLENAKTQLNAAIDAPANVIGAMSVEQQSKAVERLTQTVIDLQQASEKFKAAGLDGAFQKLSTDADAVDRAIDPAIGQLEKLRAELEKLEQAKAAGASSKFGIEVDTAAAIEIQNIINKTEEAQEASARYNEQVAHVSISWGNVGQSTALALDAAQTQLPVIQAIGAAAKMAAQEAADYAKYMAAGKSETEATALAASNLQTAQAAASSQIQQQTKQIADSNQLQAAGYVSQYAGMQKLSALQVAKDKEGAVYEQQRIAQEQAYNKVIEEGGTKAEANNRAYQVGLSYQNQIAAAADNVKGLQIQLNEETAQWRAELLGVGSAAEVVGANYDKILQKQQQIDDATAQYNAQLLAAQGGSQFNPMVSSRGQVGAFTAGGTPVSVSYAGGGGGRSVGVPGDESVTYYRQLAAQQAGGISKLVSDAYAKGGINAALSAVASAPNTFGASPSDLQQIGGSLLGPQTSTISDKISQFDSLIQLANSQTTDTSVQKANTQSEITFLRGLPASQAVDQKIADLTKSLQDVVTSTNALTASNQDLLSPYYTQDPRTSHIGFRSQGMASGGEFTVPGGYSANDNMLGTIPLASGEIVSVRRPGQDSGGGSSRPVYVTNHISVGSGANMDQFKRTVFQATQNTVRQIRAVS